MKETRTVTINRPIGSPLHLRVKGKPQVMEDGSVCLTCKVIGDGGGKRFISISPAVLEEMTEVLMAACG